MKTYTVLYRDSYDYTMTAPFAFICQADDTDHAEEQCLDAYPECDIVWVVETDNPDQALLDYYGY